MGSVIILLKGGQPQLFTIALIIASGFSNPAPFIRYYV